MEKFKIALSNGREIDDLTLNGNNFISEVEITEDIFKGGLDGVTITSSEGAEEYHEHMSLVQIEHIDGVFRFVLRDLTQYELDQAKTRSDIEYLAMMTDVDIDL